VRFPIARLVEYRNGGLDYAVVEVAASADGRRIGDLTGPANLGDPAAYPDQSVIAIVQHPNGDPKKVASGRLLKKQAEWLYYDDVDTHGGSSGSGVVTADGHLIGVHTNGGCSAMSPTPTGNTRFANAGVSIAAIRVVSTVLATEPSPGP
jgi:V8-like Glu-specific endopeptidase